MRGTTESEIFGSSTYVVIMKITNVKLLIQL